MDAVPVGTAALSGHGEKCAAAAATPGRELVTMESKGGWCIDLDNYQSHSEVYWRCTILELFEDYVTRMLLILKAPAVLGSFGVSNMRYKYTLRALYGFLSPLKHALFRFVVRSVSFSTGIL